MRRKTRPNRFDFAQLNVWHALAAKWANILGAL